jgi:hypothetical protein
MSSAYSNNVDHFKKVEPGSLIPNVHNALVTHKTNNAF